MRNLHPSGIIISVLIIVSIFYSYQILSQNSIYPSSTIIEYSTDANKNGSLSLDWEFKDQSLNYNKVILTFNGKVYTFNGEGSEIIEGLQEGQYRVQLDVLDDTLQTSSIRTYVQEVDILEGKTLSMAVKL
ncbi:hypothetical protein [Flammeovirga agarivorans]|uniref:Uncharacterized protein n=1 Tax=Flammeovirga agarivorans TaxID=2726742 RepID=A0A7X8SGK3_9BACT|nr:hypothetical protein [Flammeovirga agarivorans]NLR89712.1 hypothetical protein [Flammeovirga agarivorans]